MKHLTAPKTESLNSQLVFMLPVGYFLYQEGKDLYTTLSRKNKDGTQVKNVLVIDQSQEVDWAKYRTIDKMEMVF